MAATTRTITDTIYKLDGAPWAGATLRIDRLDRPMIDSDGTIGDIKAAGTTDADGAVSLTVAVPPSGVGSYRMTRPVESGKPVDVAYFYLGAGDPITVGEILAASASALPTDAVQTLLNAYLSKADNLASLASAATARTNLGLGTAAVAAASAFEASLGNPDADGYVLSSTALGVRSWIQSAADVDDLTTTSGSSTNMLRVAAAAGGLEYRTTAQVLSDIGAAPTASPTFTGTVTLPTTVASVIKPASDSTTALQLTNAAGTAVLTVDTTNKVVDINSSGKTDASFAINPSAKRVGFYVVGNLAGAYQNGAEITVQATGTTTAVRGLAIQTQVASGVSVPNAFNLYASGFNLGGAYGSATNAYGLRIEDISGATNNYAIYTGAGQIRFGGTVNFAGTMGNSTKTVGTDAPADWVEVQIGGTTYYLPAYAA